MDDRHYGLWTMDDGQHGLYGQYGLPWTLFYALILDVLPETLFFAWLKQKVFNVKALR